MRTSDPQALARDLRTTRLRTLALFDAFDPAHPGVPLLPIINPPRWELGHVGYFQEYWCLRQEGTGRPLPSRLAQADAWFDSSQVVHARRWHLPLPGVEAIKAYLAGVLEDSLARLADMPHDDRAMYFHRLALFHEVMHGEAFTYTLQTLARPCPDEALAVSWRGPLETADAPDIDVAAATVTMGSAAGQGFIFDNEKFAHPVALAAYRISARPVSAGQFRAFVDAGGYREARWWTPQGWQSLQAQGRVLPRYWRWQAGRLQERRFERWLPLAEQDAMVHVDAHEAEAWCRWTGRRLPSEAEWQHAAQTQRGFDWGGQVWEWTGSAFEPFPGFSPDPYREYSAPWFHDHRVVRGASFATARSLVDTRFRNFYKPDRGDPFIGFRSCPLAL